MKKDPIFTGAAVAIITPMHEDGCVNYDEFARFVDWQIDNGTDAIVICGTTGESSTLDVDVHQVVHRVCKRSCAGDRRYRLQLHRQCH